MHDLYVRPAVGEKAYLGMKWHWTVEKLSLYPHQLSSYAWLKASEIREIFKVTLKAYLGLAKSNQYSQAISKEDWGWFSGDILGSKALFFTIPNILYYHTVWCNPIICYVPICLVIQVLLDWQWMLPSSSQIFLTNTTPHYIPIWDHPPTDQYQQYIDIRSIK